MWRPCRPALLLSKRPPPLPRLSLRHSPEPFESDSAPPAARVLPAAGVRCASLYLCYNGSTNPFDMILT
jgi:hypothetical protein